MVKALLAKHGALSAFWIGNLKHRNLQGDVVSSQRMVVADEDADQDEDDEEEDDQDENRDEDADDNDNADDSERTVSKKRRKHSDPTKSSKMIMSKEKETKETKETKKQRTSTTTLTTTTKRNQAPSSRKGKAKRTTKQGAGMDYGGRGDDDQDDDRENENDNYDDNHDNDDDEDEGERKISCTYVADSEDEGLPSGLVV